MTTMNAPKNANTATMNGTASGGMTVSCDGSSLREARRGRFEGNQISENAVELCDADRQDGCDRIGGRRETVNGAQGFAPLQTGQPECFIHKGVRNRLRIHQVKSHEPENLKAGASPRHGENAIQYQATSPPRRIPREKGSALDGISGKGLELIAPGRLVERRVTEPGQNESIVKLIRLKGLHDNGHPPIFGPDSCDRIDLAQTPGS